MTVSQQIQINRGAQLDERGVSLRHRFCSWIALIRHAMLWGDPAARVYLRGELAAKSLSMP